MAVTFTDLHTESGLKSLEAHLSNKTYVSGEQVTEDDIIKVYAAVLDKPASGIRPCLQFLPQGGKSSVLMDVKPWDDETDMKNLEEELRSIQMPGLLWGASKLVPVDNGIKKLQIMLTIVDDLVSVNSLIEDHLTMEPCNEYDHSCLFEFPLLDN